ncbi:CheF family chemotaxis protein [Halalkalicoccus subterraneus]|uniref:CheF family chemotaxis protein n=1 Tax=Halalkalicoccus subterraneus TaxID=2675002 RepID=UPI000EFC13CE|nr:CheF family chemotaxis protein [Halalkalicoccus subterraneus]
MNGDEHEISDTRGRFTQVVADGHTLRDVAWTNGRVLLSNRRLVLVGNGGKRTIPLHRVRSISGRQDVNQRVARVSAYVTIRYDGHVILVSVEADEDEPSFEEACYGALLDQRVVLAKHPAVKGGVVRDTDWTNGRVKVDDDALALALADGTFVAISLDDVGAVDIVDRTVQGSTRAVVEVEHTEDGASVRTYLSGNDRHAGLLASFLERGEGGGSSGLDLSDEDREILMALYSGVSPFDIPDFLGKEIDVVEAAFERLIDLRVLEEIRLRRDVSLTARGRTVASESINEQ